MRVTVVVNRRAEIADPEGRTVLRALQDLGYTEVEEVRMGRLIHLEVGSDDRPEVRARVAEMCSELLANPVLEDYEIELGQ